MVLFERNSWLESRSPALQRQLRLQSTFLHGLERMFTSLAARSAACSFLANETRLKMQGICEVCAVTDCFSNTCYRCRVCRWRHRGPWASRRDITPCRPTALLRAFTADTAPIRSDALACKTGLRFSGSVEPSEIARMDALRWSREPSTGWSKTCIYSERGKD